MTKSTTPKAPALSHKERAITDAAGRYLQIKTLVRDGNDHNDFHEVSVWTLRAALEAAYEAGARSKG